MKTTVTITIRAGSSKAQEHGNFVTIKTKGDSLTRESAEALASGCTHFAETVKTALAVERNLIEMKKKRKHMENEGISADEALEIMMTDGVFISEEPF